MKIPSCMCGWMLAAKTIPAYGSNPDGQSYRREEIVWVCANKDCKENVAGRFVEPVWVEVEVRKEMEL